ncbi:MAG TPA: prephenate dehydrogenase/arogenate dehydrogenase family protein [Gammaproteobacteria bacterium]|nr:prephenate dehydrogenase/arogenate dehydrogenase family protein [Gammaproteobacteria bacterium]PHS05114.1 MAG: prephenate dehydrogenase [Acidithiobacillus sp.]RTZ62739.1 MAG: prephenate dehydrogenase/arogenate dehydrogenase family protein [Gammaproteobacteria bacterium]HAD37600.1 prephenate dehydrogenase/arogenate dehydrogenase family protein [Gammaproteobacteria bacterium]HBK77180.1 prephenate dehydrogenase/arogenate dehydrogenase family protein [Gammaproteobacteria bacterium]
MIHHLTIIGVGLIGGSLAKALRFENAVGHITGFGRTESSLQRAQALGVVDSWSLDLGTAVEQAEVVVIASPVNAISSTFQKLKSCLGDNAIVTDAGSVKGPIVDAAVSGLGDKIVNFVPGHPIAGKEQSGVDAASATLFKGHRTILTPIANTGTEAISTVKDMWETIGAEVVFMEPSVHDELLALTSHLPHALAFILVDLLSRQTNPEDSFDLSAGGFYDITRIASGDPVMWRDIFLSNQQAVLQRLTEFSTAIANLAELINDCDSHGLEQMFKHSNEVRRQIKDRRS